MQDIKIHKHFYLVPTEWNELTGPQLVKIIRVLYNPDLDPITCLLHLLKTITNMTWWRFYLCPASHLHENMDVVDFLVTTNTLTKNVLPCIGGFYGPGDNFNNLLMDEFVFAEDHFLRYKEDDTNTQALNDLVATLYRKPKPGYDHKRNPDGDPRQSFNENVCAYHSKHTIPHWPVEKKIAIALWYEASRNQMIKDFSRVFSNTGGDQAKWGLVSVMRNVASGGVYGDFKSVEKTFVKMIMVELDEMITDAERIEKASAKK
jgi:hypothetical protein